MPRRTRILCLLAACLLPALFLAPGCSIGYMNLHPGENSALYQSLFADIINIYDEPRWLWVRGTIQGDLDGNGVVSEELVLATIQQGTTRRPGPIEAAFLVACEVDGEGKRTAIARTMLFDRSPIPGAAKPENDIGLVKEEGLTRCRAQMVADKRTLKETVVVYFWGDSSPTSVWYAGFGFEDGEFVKNLDAVLWQTLPGLLAVNLDRSPEGRDGGYQLVFGVAAVPEAISAKLGPASDTPLWGHVYDRDGDGKYVQADSRFGEHYSQVEPAWNRQYLKAAMNGLPPEDLAWFEYHMALLNHYTGASDMARQFFGQAQRNARDDNLTAAVARLADVLEADGTAEAAGALDAASPE